MFHKGMEPYGCISKTIQVAKLRRLDINEMRIRDCIDIPINGRIVIIDRPKMERVMAKLAKKRGAKIHTGKRVKISELANEYDLIIDASGYPSQWCREFEEKPKKPAIALQARCKLECDEMIIDISGGFDGYFYTFPKSDGYANVGVGFWKSRLSNLGYWLKKYVEFMGGEMLHKTAGLIGVGLNRPFIRQCDSTTVALVGDAAGMVDPFLAEGMTKAVFGARILAECIKRGDLAFYEKKYMESMRMHYLVSNLLYASKVHLPHAIFFKIIKPIAPILRDLILG